MKRRGIFVCIIALLALCAVIVSASFSLKGENINTDYLAGDKITGTINISFNGEPAQSMIRSNLGGNITLLGLLRNNNFVLGTDYNCTIKNCLKGYKTGQEINNFTLDGLNPKIIGFKIVGDNAIDVQVKSLNLTFTSNTPPSCIRQVLVDVLNKGEGFIQNAQYTPSACDPAYYGCFIKNLSTYESIELQSGAAIKYCEKMTLPPAAAYQLGATIQNSTKGESSLKMEIYDSDWSKRGECLLPQNSQFIEDLKCVTNYTSLEVGNYFVCLSNPNGQNTNYTIRSEQSGTKCGTTQVGSTEFTRDFEIFARTMQYGLVDIDVNDKSLVNQGESSLISYINGYINDRYNNDCSGDGCIIPFKITGKQQTVSISAPELRYVAKEGINFPVNKVYLLSEEDAKINSNYLTIDLSQANLAISLNQSGQEKLEISLGNISGNNTLVSTWVNISPSFGFDIIPKSALIGVYTKFDIITAADILSSWKFGDGSTGTGNNSIFHKYLAAGDYDVEVEITKADGTKAINTFKVNVGDPKESARTIIEKYGARLANLSSQISAYPEWISKELEAKIDTVGLKTKLDQVKSDYDVATTEEDYTKVVNELISLNVPEAISVSRTGNFPFLSGYNNIDTQYIQDISNEKVTKTDKLKADIISYMDKNYAGSIDYEVISEFTDSKETPILSKFKIDVKPIASRTGMEQTYLMLNYPQEAIKFMQEYSDRPTGSGTYIMLGASEEQFEFILPGLVDVPSLGTYISPEIRYLGGTYQTIEITRKQSNIGTITLWWLVLLVLTVVAYIALQEWYKKHYEDYLFKNKDDLYNLINFIYNSRVSGMKDPEISVKLEEKGWKKEQTAYAFKKIDGKRTGMYEIPVFKFIENIKVIKEIQKRQKKPVDTKFIKKKEQLQPPIKK